MRIILILAAAVAVAGSTAFAQSSPQNSPQSPDGQKLIQLEQEWMDAMRRRDEAPFNRLIAPEFTLEGVGVFDDSERPPVPRATWIDNTLHNLRVESFSFEKTRVRVFGDAAIVQAVFTWKGVFKGEPFTDTVVLVDTWVRRGGKWQVVSRLVGDYNAPPGAK